MFFFFAKTVRFDLAKHYLSVCPTRGKLSLVCWNSEWLQSDFSQSLDKCYVTQTRRNPFLVKFKKHTNHDCRLQAFSIIIEVYFHEPPRPSFYQVLRHIMSKKWLSHLFFGEGSYITWVAVLISSYCCNRKKKTFKQGCHCFLNNCSQVIRVG